MMSNSSSVSTRPFLLRAPGFDLVALDSDEAAFESALALARVAMENRTDLTPFLQRLRQSDHGSEEKSSCWLAAAIQTPPGGILT